MDKRIMDLFDYTKCLKEVDLILLKFERLSYKVMNSECQSIDSIKLGNNIYDSNKILKKVISKDEALEEYMFIQSKLSEIYSSFCDIEKRYFSKCMLSRVVTDEMFAELYNLSIMYTRQVKKSVVFKITEGFNLSIMKGE